MKDGMKRRNVPDEVSLLASGTKACSAGDVPEVPKGQGLAPSACSAYSYTWQEADGESNITNELVAEKDGITINGFPIEWEWLFAGYCARNSGKLALLIESSLGQSCDHAQPASDNDVS